MFAILKQISLIDLNFYNLTLLLMYCFFGELLIKSHVWSIDENKGYRQSIHFSNFLNFNIDIHSTFHVTC